MNDRQERMLKLRYIPEPYEIGGKFIYSVTRYCTNCKKRSTSIHEAGTPAPLNYRCEKCWNNTAVVVMVEEG